MSEENKAIVRRFVEEVQSQHKFDVLDELFASDSINRSEVAGVSLPPGVEGFKAFLGLMFAAFPDLRATIHNQVAEGDKVATHKTFRGTDQGELMGIAPTSKTIEIVGMDVIPVVEGRCTDHWGVFDQLGMLQQIGVIPTPDA